MRRTHALFLALALALLAACGGGSTGPAPSDGDTETVEQSDGDSDTADGDSDAADADSAEPDLDVTCATDNCAIGGVCYPSGTANPAAACQNCEPASAKTTWTNLPYGSGCAGGLCDGAGHCGGADGDLDGACAAGHCAIDGACYGNGALSPASPCRKCDTSASTSAWTNLGFGTSCNDGNACTKNDTCDGQGACVGTPDSACQADGDSEYDPDIDPESVEIDGACPEPGIALCIHQNYVYCNGGQEGNTWYYTNCASDGSDCWNGICIDPNNTPDYPGCTPEDSRCVGSVYQYCSPARKWEIGVDCSSDGSRCFMGLCVSAK